MYDEEADGVSVSNMRWTAAISPGNSVSARPSALKPEQGREESQHSVCSGTCAALSNKEIH